MEDREIIALGVIRSMASIVSSLHARGVIDAAHIAADLEGSLLNRRAGAAPDPAEYIPEQLLRMLSALADALPPFERGHR